MERRLDLKNGQYITYKYINNSSNADFELMYLHGFYGDMDGRKGAILDNIAKETNLNLIKLNYLGHGTSSGRVSDFTMTDWFDNIKDLINTISNKKLILIGSSMGGWLSYLTAIEYRDKIKAIITFSTAVDFFTEVIEPMMPDKDTYEIINPDGKLSGCIITKNMIKDSKQYNLLNKSIIDINCPITMIHGLKDTLIPYQTQLRFFEKLTSDASEFRLIKELDHRLLLDGNLELIKNIIINTIRHNYSPLKLS